MTKTIILFSALFAIGIEFVSAQDSTGFEKGLSGWETSGRAMLVHQHAFHWESCVEIKGTGGLHRRFRVDPLAIVLFKVFIKSGDDRSKGYTSINFYNANDQLILRYQGKTIGDTSYQQSGYYTEAPADAKYFIVMVNKDSSGEGTIYVDDMDVEPNVEGKPAPAPECDLNQYMRPFWKSDTVYDEAILLLSRNGANAYGRLLYQPLKIISIKSYDLKTTYQSGKDYMLKGDTVVRTIHSEVPFKKQSFFSDKDLAWFNIQSQWVLVTYIHAGHWKGPVPSYKGNNLPKTMAKLRAKKPLTIVAYGMSITRGMDVSGYDKVPPYMPPYVQLFAWQLGKIFNDDDIKLYNAGLPGATAEWGAKYAEKYVNPLHPDLTIIDFGMNDFWNDTPEQFKAYIETIMRKVRMGNPKVEFLLLSNIHFDPSYILDSDKNRSMYLSRVKGYNKMLQELQEKGVIDFDMTTISHILYSAKNAKDCLVNPMHPNDYLARWYAQGMTALFVPDKLAKRSKGSGRRIKNSLVKGE